MNSRKSPLRLSPGRHILLCLRADCQQRSGRRLKKHEPQLQAGGTRFNLFYSADGSDGAIVYTFLYLYGAKLSIIFDSCKHIDFFCEIFFFHAVFCLEFQFVWQLWAFLCQFLHFIPYEIINQ